MITYLVINLIAATGLFYVSENSDIFLLLSVLSGIPFYQNKRSVPRKEDRPASVLSRFDRLAGAGLYTIGLPIVTP